MTTSVSEIGSFFFIEFFCLFQREIQPNYYLEKISFRIFHTIVLLILNINEIFILLPILDNIDMRSFGNFSLDILYLF